MFDTIRGHTVYAPPLRPDSIVVDLGANRGEFAKQMSDRYGGTYYLVEANPLLAEALRAQGLAVWHCAVAATEGQINFNIAQNDEGSSILTLPAKSDYNCVLRESVPVQARTIKSLLAEMGAPRIDLLKMDIEGAEVMVLKGLAGDTLRRIGQITVEFHSDPVFGFGLHRDVEEVISYLRQHGFQCLDFSGRSRWDVLFINRNVYNVPWLRCMGSVLQKKLPLWRSRAWDRLRGLLK